MRAKPSKDLSAVRWSPKLETFLEDIIVRNQFDFKNAAKEFQRHLNSKEGDTNGKFVYLVDTKTLQLKWTDIEIRRHVIPNMHEIDAELDSE